MRLPRFLTGNKRRAVPIVALLAAVAAAVVGYTAIRRYSGGVPEPSREDYAVRGIDISAHNGAVDFAELSHSGEVDFVMMKATEGTNFKDARFIDNYRGATEVGLKIGVYHFFRFDSDSEMQALNLLHSVRHRAIDFPLVIDIEEWGNPDGLATSKIVSSLRTMISVLETAGHQVMLYTNKDGYRRFVEGNFDDYPLWICSFSDPPVDGDWSVWQYSHRGSVPGIRGKVDMNVIRPGACVDIRVQPQDETTTPH